MPRIPIYQQQVGVPRNTPRTDVFQAPEIVDTSEGLRAAAGAVGGVVQKVQTERDEQALLDYDVALAQLDRRMMDGDEQTPGAKLRLGRDAAGVTANSLKGWDTEAERLLPKLRSADAQARAKRLRTVRREDLHGRLWDHEIGQSRKADIEASESALATYNSDAIANADDDQVVEANRARGRAEIARQAKNQGWDEATAKLKLAEWDSATVKGVVAAKLGRDPVGAIDYFEAHMDELVGPDLIAVQNAVRPHVLEIEGRIRGDALLGSVGVPTNAPSGFAANVAHVLKSEGGYVANDGGAGPTKYGINSRAHPGVDVSKLTPEDATRIYKREYWDALGIDSLPPAMQGQVFDAAVNQGKGWTRNALLQAQGDPIKFAALRRQRYQELAAAEPGKFGRYLKGWLARVDRLAPTGPAAVRSTDPHADLDQLEVAALTNADAIGDDGIQSEAKQRIREVIGRRRALLQENGRAQQAAKAAAAHRFSNAAAKLQAGVPVPLPERPSEAELAPFYGADEARRMVSELDTYARLAPDIALLSTATEAEAGAIVSKYTPNPASDNFAFEMKAHEVMIGAWQQAKTLREADPAAFLADRSPAVRAKAQAMLDAQRVFADAAPTERAAAGEAMQAQGEQYAAFLLGEQERLGIPYSKRALLPVATAARLRDEFEGKLAQGDVAGAVNGIRAAVQSFGDAGVHVLPQLGENASPIARFALEGLDLRTIETLAASTRDGLPVLKKAVGDQWAPLEQAVRASLASFDATGSSEYPAYYDATVMIAAAKVRGGMDPATAAQQAAHETINGRYAFGGKGAQVHYRVPLADIRGRPIDTQSVIRGADRELASLQPKDISISDSVPPGVDVTEFKAFRLARIRRTGRWLNLGDESGLVLAWQDDNMRFVTARGADGKPIRRTWAQLAVQTKTREVDQGYYGALPAGAQ